ncbi:hypothetical protein GCM10023203_05060 [Actinomycetospora straminea]|uniref:Uncharacterized protein n=1 Tax=Actinomycetospora straminea TaxID=663607 RepID=A0ABP9DUZ4_9PSEU
MPPPPDGPAGTAAGPGAGSWRGARRAADRPLPAVTWNTRAMARDARQTATGSPGRRPAELDNAVLDTGDRGAPDSIG